MTSVLCHPNTLCTLLQPPGRRLSGSIVYTYMCCIICICFSFVVVSDPTKRAAIRQVVEKEEQINYDRRMKLRNRKPVWSSEFCEFCDRESWVDDLKPIMSNLHSRDDITKPYLTTAPYLIIVMKEVRFHFAYTRNATLQN